MIFITEHDIGKKGLPMYHINRYVEETEEAFEDGVHLIYVNGTCKDDTPLGKLMHDFTCQDPNDMNYEILAERVRYFKTVKKGVESMCEILEQMRNESYQSGWIKGKEVGKQEGKKEGKEEGIQEGKLEGFTEGKRVMQIEMTKRLLIEGSLSAEKIANMVGLPIEEVVQLKRSNLN